MTGIAWGNDFYNPVRRTAAAFVRELIPVTYHANVRCHHRIPVLEQLHGKRSGIDPAGAAF